MNDINLISSPHFATWSSNHTVKFVVEKGFDCQFQTADMSRNTQKEVAQKEPIVTAWYFRARRSHPGGHFWLKVALFPQAPGYWSWVIEVGDIAGYADDKWHPTIVREIHENPAQFHFQAFYEAGHEIALASSFEDGKPTSLEVSPSLITLNPELRYWLARGWYWMGIGLKEALELCQVQLTGTETAEWVKSRTDDIRQCNALN